MVIIFTLSCPFQSHIAVIITVKQNNFEKSSNTVDLFINIIA